MSTIVLTHGAFHGGWCFAPLVAELEQRGVTCVLAELPLTDLTDDVAALTAVLDECEGPVTLLGHSYGGAVITVAGVHRAVDRLVYLAALAPDVGENAGGGPAQIGEQFMAALRFSDDGTMSIDHGQAAGLFYPDIDVESANHWASFLRPGNTGGSVLVTETAWRTRPSTYVVCADDPVVLAAGQREIAQRMGARVVEIAGDHSPMVARPAELADLLVEAMR